MIRFPSSWLPRLLAASLLLRVGLPNCPAQSTNREISSTALEALQRLRGMDLEANPALRSAVLRILESTRGTARFVEIVRDFSLTGQEAGLIEVATALPGESAGVEAIRLVLKSGGAALLKEALKPEPAATGRRPALARALANSFDPAAVPLLADLLADPTADAALRATAIHGLAGTESGARRLLQSARDGRLDDAARNTAALDLAQSRWPAICAEAAIVLPLPRTADGGELPPLTELVKLTGDAARGAKLFRGDRAACIKCHRVGAEGVDFGPALTEIGTKLARQALFESIVDPSAGISFGFEAWSIETRDGEEVFGLIASETATELAIRQAGGIVVRLKKSEVVRRERQKLSAMPAGLAQLLTRQELVDLVDYLASLKAPAK